MARRHAVIAHALVVASVIVPATGTASPSAPVCFGGAPEVVVRDQPQAGDLRIHGRKLLWTSRGWVRSFDLDAGTVATIGAGDVIGAVDERFVVVTSARNQLSVLDRRTRKRRVLVDGSRALELALVTSSVGLDGRYVYFGRTAPDYRRAEEAGFFRVPIAGGRSERLALLPDGDTPFLVAKGDVVWLSAEQGAFIIHKRPLAGRGPERDERRPVPASGSITSHTSTGALRLVGDEIYFTADNGIWSAALDREEPARERVPNASPGAWADEPAAPVVHGSCAYFAAGGVIRRARMDSGAAPETVVPADLLDKSSVAAVATDGRHLYWASHDGHIVRAGPSIAPRIIRPPLVAKPAPVQRNRGATPSEILLGDDVGCLFFIGSVTDGGWKWRCWRAGTAPVALEMPGLGGVQLVRGSGRICTKGFDRVRCALEKEVFDSRGQVLRTTEKMTGTQVFVGAAFVCTLGNDGWRCTGDDTYGQLAAGAMVEPAPPGGGTWVARWGALGASHGCVSTDSGKTACWGRNDVGQLGHVSPDVCRVGGAAVPCTRSPRETAAPPRGWLLAGDQFTCDTGKGLWCWGGSRDGVFGTADACPASMRQTWPTRAGSTAAPHATCARVPVRVAGFSDADMGRPSPAWERMRRVHSGPQERPRFGSFSVGPRGICAIAYGKIRCRGAIPTPTIPKDGPELFDAVVVSTGDRPSACASSRGQLLCWGEGYSPASDLARPVEIDYAEGTSGGAPVVDFPRSDGGAWPKECFVHRACSDVAPPLPACAARASTPTWAELQPRAAALLGTTIVVRGALGVGGVHISNPGRDRCGKLTDERRIVVGATDLDADGMLMLDGPLCQGDDSRLCCRLPAYGQQVRVEGKLERLGTNHYSLTSPKVCQDSAR